MMAFPTPPLARELLEGEACFITYACVCKINACQWYPHIQGLEDMLDQLSQESGWSSMGLRGDVSPKGAAIPPRNSQTSGLTFSGKGPMLTEGSKHRKSRPEGPTLGMQPGEELKPYRFKELLKSTGPTFSVCRYEEPATKLNAQLSECWILTPGTAPLLPLVPVSHRCQKPQSRELEGGALGLFLIPEQELAPRKHCLRLTTLKCSFVIKRIFILK